MMVLILKIIIIYFYFFEHSAKLKSSKPKLKVEGQIAESLQQYRDSLDVCKTRLMELKKAIEVYQLKSEADKTTNGLDKEFVKNRTKLANEMKRWEKNLEYIRIYTLVFSLLLNCCFFFSVNW